MPKIQSSLQSTSIFFAEQHLVLTLASHQTADVPVKTLHTVKPSSFIAEGITASLDESNSRATTEIGRVENQDVGARIKEIVKKKRKKRTAHVLVQR